MKSLENTYLNIHRYSNELELMKSIFMNILANIFYMNYLSSMDKQFNKEGNIKFIRTPNISIISQKLNEDSIIIKWLRKNFIDELTKNSLYIKYKNTPLLKVLDNKEILDVFFNLNIFPFCNVIINEKINNSDINNPIFRHDPFGKLDNEFINKLDKIELDYIVEEFVLCVLINSPSTKLKNKYIHNNSNFLINNNQAVLIKNEKAIYDTILDSKIINDLHNIMNIICFVTNTNISKYGYSKSKISTNMNNNVSILDI